MMVKEQVFSLSELAERSGASRRSVQLWADAGALIVEGRLHPGSGCHRIFCSIEVEVACALNALKGFGVPIGKLQEVAPYVRETLRFRVGRWLIISGLKAMMVESEIPLPDRLSFVVDMGEMT